jgi:anti-sigma B factor antagonist
VGKMSDQGTAFRVDVTDPAEGGPPIVRVVGEIDLATARRLAAVLDPLVEAGASEVVVDVAGVSFIDSSGLAVLAGASTAGTNVVVRSPSEILQRILKATGLDEVLQLEP